MLIRKSFREIEKPASFVSCIGLDKPVALLNVGGYEVVLNTSDTVPYKIEYYQDAPCYYWYGSKVLGELAPEVRNALVTSSVCVSRYLTEKGELVTNPKGKMHFSVDDEYFRYSTVIAVRYDIVGV